MKNPALIYKIFLSFLLFISLILEGLMLSIKGGKSFNIVSPIEAEGEVIFEKLEESLCYSQEYCDLIRSKY